MMAASEQVIAALSRDLRAVRRLRPPVVRAAIWLGAVAVSALILVAVAGVSVPRLQFAMLPDMRFAALGAALTAVCAGIAAFQLSVPGRSSAWLLLPGPGLALWLGASGLGCLRDWGLPGLAPAEVPEAAGCAIFIAAVSLPLSALLLAMLRRAVPLHPGRVGAMAGLAAAAAAASLLSLSHPHDASVADLAFHVAGVGLVIVANNALGGRLLASIASSP